MGGGFDAEGKPVLGELPSPGQFGDASAYNYQEVYSSADRQQFRPTQGKPEWAMNWDEDEGARRVSELLLLLHAAHLQPLLASRLSRSLPESGALQDRGLRTGAARRDQVRGQPELLPRLPLQEDLLQSAGSTSASTASAAFRASRRAWRPSVYGSARVAPCSWGSATTPDSPVPQARRCPRRRLAPSSRVRHRAERLLRAAALSLPVQARRTYRRRKAAHPAGPSGIAVRSPRGRRHPHARQREWQSASGERRRS